MLNYCVSDNYCYDIRISSNKVLTNNDVRGLFEDNGFIKHDILCNNDKIKRFEIVDIFKFENKDKHQIKIRIFECGKAYFYDFYIEKVELFDFHVDN